VLGCAGLTRVDFLIDGESGKIVLNEPNTLPGFTNISMYPKLIMDTGMTYAELIDKLLALAAE
ncbi:MAG: D-alanine--D-alanine ligase, partial [Oscillospiraceae bacterium]|nr:D-alanine--D-alanine ligase [Oscillospiraceae bacterium]